MSELKKISLSQYITDSIKIAKSFHIYFDTLKKQSSILTFKLYGFIVDDDKNKYNLNMAGMLSDIDTPLTFSLDDNEVYLSPKLVKNNEFLKESLTEFDSYYNSLVSNNPHLATYVKGCIAGIPLDKVLKAKNGEILWYNKDLFQNDRRVVINNVQKFIYSFLDIYHNQDYVVDELYAAGMLSNLYSILPMVILVEKLAYVKTYRTDDFHMYNYFKSYKNMSDEIDILDRKTMTWLYGNLDLLKTYIGHNTTLDSVAKNVMDSLGLGIGKMYAEKTVPVITNNVNNLKKDYYKKDIQVKQFAINSSFSLNRGKVESIDKVTLREYGQDYIKNKEQIEVEDKDLEYMLKYSIPTKELTKVLPIDDIILTNQDDINKFAYFVNSLIYQTEFSNSKATINFFNPSDGIVYKLNSKQIMVLFLMLTFRIFNISDNPIINGLQYANVLDLEAAKSFNVDNYKLNDEEKIIVKEMLKDLDKLPSEIVTITSFRNYYNISYSILRKFWYYLSNMNDVIYSTDLLFILNTLFGSGSSSIINGRSLKELQAEVKLPIKEIPNENVIPTFKRLLETIVGDDIYKIDKIKSYLNKILKIGEKLTSYTVQFLYSNSLSYIITGHYQTLKPFLGKKSLLTVSDATYRMYEHVDKKLINKNIPALDLLNDKEIASAFRMYKPCNLEIVNMNNRLMLTRATDVSFIRTGDTFPQLMKPDTKAKSIIEAKEIKTDSLHIRQLLTSYPLSVSGHKEAIGTSSYITNTSGLKFPKMYQPESIFVNGYYATELTVNKVNDEKITSTSKLELNYYDNITTSIGKLKFQATIPSNYKPISKYKNIKDIDLNVTNKDINKLTTSYNPEIINYSNVMVDASRIKSSLVINNMSPKVLPYNGDADKLVIQDKDNSTKNNLPSKPIMKNVPEIMGERNDVNIYKVNNFTPDAKGIDPNDDIVYKTTTIKSHKPDKKPSIIKTPEITTGNSKINNDNIKFMTPSTMNYDYNKDTLSEEFRDNIVTKHDVSKPRVKNVPELTTERSDVILETVNNFTPNANGMDPSDDIVVKATDTRNHKPDKKPSIIKANEISTGSTRLNNDNIKFMTPGMMNYSADKDTLNEESKDNIVMKHDLSKPEMKYVPEIMSERNDIVLEKVGSFTPEAKGSDPSDDIVVKDTDTREHKSVQKPSIVNTVEITTNASRVSNDNIKFMTPSTMNYDYNKDTLSEEFRDNATVKRDLGKPQMKHVPEIMNERNDAVLKTIGSFSPDAGGSDPSDDIVYKAMDSRNHKLDQKLSIANVDEISTGSSKINNKNIKPMAPTTMNYDYSKDSLSEDVRDNTITKRDLGKPQMKHIPEIMNERNGVVLNAVNTYKPEAGGSDPSDDIVYKNISSEKQHKIDKLEIDRVPEISIGGTKIQGVRIPMASFIPYLYNLDKERIADNDKDNTITKRNLGKPQMKHVPEIMNERNDTVLETVNAFSPEAGGSDPSDDIVHKSINISKKTDISKLSITQSPEIMSQYSTLTTEAIKLYSPIPLMYNEEFYQKETHNRGDVQKITNPILAQTPEITTPNRTDMNDNSETGMFNPEANGVDPSDDVAENTTKPVKIRNIEEPTIRVARHEDIGDIPVIKIKH